MIDRSHEERTKIVAFIRATADEIAPPDPDKDGDDPLWTTFSYLHGVATKIEEGKHG